MAENSRQIELVELLQAVKASQKRQSNASEVAQDVLNDGADEASQDALYNGAVETWKDVRYEAADGGRATLRSRRAPIRVKPSAAGTEHDELLRELLDFFHSGRKPEGWAQGSDNGMMPLLLDGYREAARLRLSYPAVLLDVPDSETPPAVPIRDLFDKIVARSVEGEERDHLKHDLLRLEYVMRSLEPRTGERFSDLWLAASENLLRKASASERSALNARLDAARADVSVDGSVLECGATGTIELFRAVSRRAWRRDADALVGRVDILLDRLRQMLHTGDGHSADGLGIDEHAEIDSNALKGVLSQVRLAPSLAEPRRRRLSEAVETLAALRRALNDQASWWENTRNEVAPFIDLSGPDASASAGALIAGYRSRVANYVAALRIAELEFSNLYREEKHDRAFADFTWPDVRPEEAAAFPPVLAVLDASRAGEDDRIFCLDLLESRAPIKLLVLVDNLFKVDPDEQAIHPVWWARFATLATSSYGVYVMQDVAADVSEVQDRFSEGIQVAGPALFCIYAGGAEREGQNTLLVPELMADAARDSRIFPSFRYNPRAGADLAARMHIAGNADVESSWTSGEHAVVVEGEDVLERFTFTAGDFAGLVPDLRRFFLDVPAEFQHSGLTPLIEWLGAKEKGRKVPMIEAVAPDGRVHSVVVSAAVARMVGEVADGWRRLQELGGAANSYVEKVLGEERARLRDEHETELAALRASHEEELRRASTAATEEIISNIAAGLLNMPMTAMDAVLPSAGPTARAALQKAASGGAEAVGAPENSFASQGSAAPQELAASQAAVLDDDEELTFDDPYIDTPLCTTCNECTNINGLLFAYNADQQAVIKDPNAGTYRQLVTAAELCPVHIIHPGKPRNPDEPRLEDLMKRAQPYL